MARAARRRIAGSLIAGVLALTLGSCATPPLDVASSGRSGSPRDERSSIDGVYLNLVTEHQLRAAGVANTGDILENTGAFTFRFEDGRWTFDQCADHDVPSGQTHRTGSYTLIGHRFTIYWNAQNRDDITQADVRVAADKSLRFSGVLDHLDQHMSEGFFAAHPWPRVVETTAPGCGPAATAG